MVSSAGRGFIARRAETRREQSESHADAATAGAGCGPMMDCSRFYRDVEPCLSTSVRALITDFGCPIPKHAWFDFGLISAGLPGGNNRARWVHLHPRHAHIQFEFYGPDIH